MNIFGTFIIMGGPLLLIFATSWRSLVMLSILGGAASVVAWSFISAGDPSGGRGGTSLAFGVAISATLFAFVIVAKAAVLHRRS